MSWALILGGAECVYEDLQLAIKDFGQPDVVVAVKDIWIEYPKVDHVATFHIDRIPRELIRRRALGYADPKVIWTYKGVREPRGIGIEVRKMHMRGGSSGLLGAFVALQVADRGVLAGIPMNPGMRHYHNRKGGKAWGEARIYTPHWEHNLHFLTDRIKSMSGWTREKLGAPTKEWVLQNAPTPVT